MKTRLTLLTSASLLLAACGQPAAPTTGTPSPAAPVASSPAPTTGSTTPARAPFVNGAVYQVSFQGVGGDGLTAQAQAVRSGVGTQVLESAPDNLNFKLLSRSTFTVQSTGRRYVKATFQVQNTSGQTLTNLKFVPVDTDEDSTGPSNNGGSVPTVGTTSFNNVTYFDGSDASSKADSLTPGQGQNFNAASGAAEADSGASTFATGLDTSSLSVTPPTGLLIAGVKNYGWNVAASLTPGATANVTFAVDLPLDSAGPTKDPFNFSLVFTAAQDGPTSISAIQGPTSNGNAASPLNGQKVVTQGVVTSVTPGLSGFFIETPDADQDGDPNTSEGLFVYCGTGSTCPAVKVGDLVRVTGTVAEFPATGNGTTQIASVTDVTVKSSNNALPTAAGLVFPLTSRDTLEKYEGMLVTVPTTMTVTDTFSLGRYGQLGLSSGGRVFSPTNADGTSSANALRRLSIDDGVTSQNPTTIPFLSGTDPLTATRRGGDSVTDLTGVLNYNGPANDYLLYPTVPPSFVSANPRPAAPDPVGGTLKVASANVENFFTQLVTSNSGCTTDGFDSTYSRGANDCTEFARDEAKVVAELKGLDADVVSLMEVQNGNVGSDHKTKVDGTGDNALKELTRALNAAYGSTVYAYVPTGIVGTDAIHVAMIYKVASVSLAATDTAAPAQTWRVDDNAVYSRPPLAQTFTQISNGEKFSVIANHLKSKGSCPSTGDTDTGQGCWNKLRVQQAQALLSFAASVQASSGDPDVLLVGDMNSYALEDPINTLIGGGYESLNKRIDAADRYSYAFSGAYGYLDHALSSGSLSGQVSGITEWHINSDEPVVFDFNTEFKNNPDCKSATCTSPDFNNVAGSPTPYRTSDHDPVLVGLDLSATFKVNASGADNVTQNQTYTLNVGSNKTPNSLSVDWGDGSAPQNVTPNGTSTAVTHAFATPGNVIITVTGTQNGATSTDTKAVTVNATPTNVTTLSLSNSGNVSAQQGGNATEAITVTATGSSNPVALSAVSDTAGVTVSLNPASVSGASDSTSTANVLVDSGVAAGTVATITVSGTGDAGNRSTAFTVTVTPAGATTPGKLVISQVYGGGGNTGAPYRNDYVELFNAGSSAVSLSGYSLQYASATGTFNGGTNTVSLPAGSVQPGAYYLVQLAAGTNATSTLPTPDATGNIALSATAGKVALSRSTVNVSGSSDSNVLDFVGFGATASDKEGTATAVAPSNTTALFRAGSGCSDTNQNGSDFSTGAPAPRNSASPTNLCVP